MLDVAKEVLSTMWAKSFEVVAVVTLLSTNGGIVPRDLKNLCILFRRTKIFNSCYERNVTGAACDKYYSCLDIKKYDFGHLAEYFSRGMWTECFTLCHEGNVISTAWQKREGTIANVRQPSAHGKHIAGTSL